MGCTSARSRWRQEPAMLGLLPVTALGLAAAPPAAAVPAAGRLVSAAATSESRPCRDLLAKVYPTRVQCRQHSVTLPETSLAPVSLNFCSFQLRQHTYTAVLDILMIVFSTHRGGSVAGLRGWVVAMASAVLGQEEPWEPGTEFSPTAPAEAQSRFCPWPQQQR
ncbi:hypothetical protein Anapl_06778 [Anas platyrhynchos]|uniref:Uncharacterized protein n=1 Tax=Anas platyrhynchos TaxID=8839 RepID=R0K7N3_ANAPL|nr:hypothetical protein Anapl_06778 [Anas platyrhynchos]